MGSGRCSSLSPTSTAIMVIFVLQLISTIERLVFDFLGYMWAPIMGNFFQIICVIVGIFGVCQYRPCLIAVYSTWSLIWIGWNVFVICLYLEIGILNRNNELYILNIGTKNKSWWLEHGIGCHVTNDTWEKNYHGETSRPIPPEEFVEGCLIDYYYVEFIHAAVQCLFSFIGFIFSCITIYVYTEEDESSTSANDEMEFVKMRYKCPAQSSFRDHQRHGTDHTTSLESLGPTNGGPPSLVSSEKPPSYDTFINDATIPPYYATAMATGGTMAAGTSAQTATVPIYATVDRRSLRSKASQRSKSSKNKDKRKELPWVHVTPSSNYLDYSHHHHHHHHHP